MNTQNSGLRLKTALRQSAIAPSKFAADLGISNQALNNWFVRGLPGSRLLAVAKYLKLRPEWLDSGEGEPFADDWVDTLPGIGEQRWPTEVGQEWDAIRNVEMALQPTRAFEYPEISWVQAGSATEAMDSANIATCPRHSSDAWAGHEGFWLKVVGSSMTSPAGPSFPEGMLILVAPDIEPRSGQYVVARMIDSNEATFKQLVKDAGELFLKQLNPAYPTKAVDDTWEIVGTVVDGKMPKSVFA